MSQTPTPAAPSLPFGEDSGSSDSDGIIDVNNPILTGQTLPNAVITLYDNNTATSIAEANADAISVVTADANGFYSFYPFPFLDDGKHSLTITATAPGGTQSEFSAPLAIVVDTSKPDAPVAPQLAAGYDTGASAEDGITDKNVVQLTGQAEPGSTVALYLADLDKSKITTNNEIKGPALATAVTAANGTYTLTTAKLADGIYNFSVTATDVAGNVSMPSAPSSFTIDTMAPAAPSAASLSPGTDTGVSHTDGLTDNAAPAITGTAEANATVSVYDQNAGLIGKGTADANGNYAITPTSPLSDGAHAILVVATDAAGNVSAQSPQLNIDVDTQAATGTSAADPSTATLGEVIFDLHFSEPVSGLTKRALQLTATGSASGDIGAVTGSGTDYTVTVSGLVGDGTLKLGLSDNANVTGIAGDPVTLTGTPYTFADNMQPQISTIATIGAVTDGWLGLSAGGRLVAFDSGDALTNGASSTGTSIYLADALTGALTLVSVGLNGAVANGSSGFPSLSADGKTIVFTSDASNLVADGPTDGSNNVYVAHLSSNASGTGFTVSGIELVSSGNGHDGIDDNTANTAPAISADGTHVAFVSDQPLIAGVQPGYNVYEKDLTTGALSLVSGGTSGTGVAFAAGGLSGDAEAVDVSLSQDGSEVAYLSNADNLAAVGALSSGVVRTYVYSAATGATSVFYAATALGLTPNLSGGYATISNATPQISANGKFVTYSIEQRDPSVGAVQNNDFIVEQVISTGQIVQVTSDTLAGYDADYPNINQGGRYIAYSATQLSGLSITQLGDYVDDTVTGTNTFLANAQAPFLSADGNAVAYLTYPAADGSQKLVLQTLGPVIGVDDVGNNNLFDASAWTEVQTDGLLVSGESNQPNTATVTLSLLNADQTVLTMLTKIPVSNGAWSATIPASVLAGLGDGSYLLSAIASGDAGASFPAGPSFIVDTAAPTTPDAPKLDAGSDTSTAGDGSATSLAMPVFTGTAEAGAIVSLYDSLSATPATPIGTAIADSNGVYAVTPDADLISAKHVFTVTATDAAGNVSDASAGDTVIVDTIAPDQPKPPMLQPAPNALGEFAGSSLVDDPSAPPVVSSDTGISDTDGITNNASPNVVGIAEPNTTVTLYDTDGIAMLGTAKTDANGKYTIASSNLSDGVHSLTVTDTDDAGNVSKASTPLSVTIDTLPPAMPTISSVTGPLVSGDITELVTVNGTAEPGSKVQLVLDGGMTAASIFGETTAASDGDYSLNSDPLPAGDGQNLSVTATDVAGNTSQGSLPVDVNITDSATPPPGTPPFTPTLLGLLTDGPIAGATVFADGNGNGVRDADEGSGVTDTDGSFQLTDTGGELIASGGTDTATGLANLVSLNAPAGSKVISPLTTLLDAYQKATAGSLAAAQAAVTAALGLEGGGGTDLTALDPNAAALSGSTALDPAVADGAPLIASAKIMDTAIDLANALAGDVVESTGLGPGIDALVGQFFPAVIAAMASVIQQTGALDLNDPGTLNTILDDAASTLLLTPLLIQEAANQTTIVAVVAAENADLDALAPGATLPAKVAQIEAVAQGQAAPALEALPFDQPATVTNVQTQYTGQALFTATSAALALLSGPPQLAAASDTGASNRDNTTTDIAPTIIGAATPGTFVTLVLDQLSNATGLETYTVIGTGRADATGHYSIAVSPLPTTPYNFLTDSGLVIGAVASATDPGVALGDLITAPASLPTLTLFFDDSTADAPFIISATPAGATGDDAGDSALLVYGQAATGFSGSDFLYGAINVYADGGSTPVGTGLANADGSFAITTTPLTTGAHTLVLTETLAGGTILPSTPAFDVTVAAAAFTAGSASAIGAIAGATVFQTGNFPNDGGAGFVLDDTLDAVASVTDGAGAYTDTYAGGSPLTVLGGYDTVTGLPIGGYIAQTAPDPVYLAGSSASFPALLAPDDFPAVTPLTTILALLDSSGGIQGAPTPADNDGNEAVILSAFGLSPDLDLASLNPLAEAQAGDPAALLLMAKLLDTVTILSGPYGFSFLPIADYLAGSGTMDLDSASDIEAAYAAIVPSTSEYIADLPAFAALAAASNQALDTHAAAATSLADTLSYTLAAETVAQEAETAAVETAALADPDGGSAVTALAASYTGAALDTAITAARSQATQATSFVPAGPLTTAASSVVFTVTFSQAVTGLAAGNFSVVAGGDLTGAHVAAVAAAAGSGGTVFDVTVATGAGQGSLALTFSSAGLTDGIGEPITGGLFAPVESVPGVTSNIAGDGNTHGSIAVGDFNNDGRPDVILTDGDSGGARTGATLYLNNGDGSFTAQAPVAGVLAAFDVLVGDFNGDGKLDVAEIGSATDAAPATLAILLGNGNGSFQPAIDTQVPLGNLAAGDFNGDGRLDVAVSNFDGDSITILQGNGAGGFSTGQVIATTGPSDQIAAADLTGNGKFDLITTNQAAGTVSVYLGNGDGTFTAASQGPITVDGAPGAIAVGDLNGDGIPDIVAENTVTDANDLQSVSVTVLLGDGHGAFTAATPFALPQGVTGPGGFLQGFAAGSIAIGDLNNDGKPDLVLAGTHGTITLNGNGDGTFTLGQQLADPTDGSNFGGDAGKLALADADGDGRTDILEIGPQTSNSGIPIGEDGGEQGNGLNVLLNEAPVVLGSTSAPITIDRPSVAQAAIAEVSGGGTLTQAGNTYTLDLGSLTQGQTAANAVLAILNAATGTADSLDGLFGTPAGSGFTISGDTLPAALAAGQSFDGLTFAVDTGTAGSHTETITFAPRDVTTVTAPVTSLDGINGATTQDAAAMPDAVALELPAITLVVKDDVTTDTSPPAVAALGVLATSIVLPNVRVGATDTQALTLTNTATAPADGLDVTGTASGDATVGGSISALAAGASDDTSVVAGLDTSSAGAKTGTIVLTPVSKPDTTLATDSIAVSGSVYREATATAAAINIVVHVGDTGSAAIKISNTDTADGFSEALVASLTGISSGLSIVSGSPTADIAAGASDASSLVFGFSTATATTITGTATIGVVSDGGTGAGSIDGLGEATLTSITVPITVTVEQAAATENQAALGVASSSIVLPNVRVGATDTAAIAVSNAAVAPADNLDVSAAASGDVTVSGSIAGLAAGASDNTSLIAGLDTSSAGAKTGGIVLTPISEPGTTLATDSLAVSGSVYREAAAAAAAVDIVVHVGDPGSAALKISNTDTADGFSEVLVASLTGVSSGLSIAAGSATPGIAAGASDSSLEVGFSTATAGTITGTATLGLVSDGGTGAGSIDGLGQTALPAVTVPIMVTVDNLAQASITSQGGNLTAGSLPGTWNLDLGTATQGSTALVAALSVLNSAGGPADLLGGGFALNGSTPFSNSGFTSFAGLGAGASAAAGSISLSSAQLGAFSETLTLNPTDTEGVDAPTAQTPQTVTITGNIVAASGTAVGDVHMVTFDGLHYDFQATGDFVLARATTPGDSFQVQMRAAEYLTNPGTSVATEISAQLGHDEVSFNIADPATVSVNGIADFAIADASAQQQLDGGTLTALSSSSYQLTWNTGETLNVTNNGVYLDSSVQLSPKDGAGAMQGLLGSDSGQANDFQLPDGTVLAQPVATATLLGTFADAWRVAPAASLLNSGSQDETVRIGMGSSLTSPGGSAGAMQFIHAVSNAANDQIIATGKGQIPDRQCRRRRA